MELGKNITFQYTFYLCIKNHIQRKIKRTIIWELMYLSYTYLRSIFCWELLTIWNTLEILFSPSSINHPLCIVPASFLSVVITCMEYSVLKKDKETMKWRSKVWDSSLHHLKSKLCCLSQYLKKEKIQIWKLVTNYSHNICKREIPIMKLNILKKLCRQSDLFILFFTISSIEEEFCVCFKCKQMSDLNYILLCCERQGQLKKIMVFWIKIFYKTEYN